MLSLFGIRYNRQLGKKNIFILKSLDIEGHLDFTLKYRNSKISVLLLNIKTVFPMFDKGTVLFVNYGCMIRSVRGT